MSAANASAPPSSLQEESRAHEPSMEEILASIRRIIADDQMAPVGRPERESRRLLDRSGDSQGPASAAQKAYPAPALGAGAASSPVEEPVPASAPGADDDITARAPVVEIRQLRLHRAAPPLFSDPDPAEESGGRVKLEQPFAAPAGEKKAPARGPGDDALVSDDTASSVASHFQTLATSMILNDPGALQRYAQEMMRPMLKQWLDDNLPVIVERLVRAEIERVARGGRR